MLSLLCPPCPSNIVNKLAFSPPDPTYSIEFADQQDQSSQAQAQQQQQPQPQQQLQQTTTHHTSQPQRNSQEPDSPSRYKFKLEDRAEWQFSLSDLDKFFEVFFAHYGKNERIACTYMQGTKNPKFTILFSHGNAADIGLMSSFYMSLGFKMNCNVFGYDYSGYGASSGKPSEKSLYQNIDVAWTELQRRYGLQANQVILYGQSIGTVPTIDLASKHEFAGVILHSPLTSGLRLAFPNTKRTWFFDAFPNIDKVPKIKSPVLVIHGTEDEVIDISHGHMIHSLCRNPVSPLWVEGAGHNDIEYYREYLDRLKKFIYSDIKTQP